MSYPLSINLLSIINYYQFSDVLTYLFKYLFIHANINEDEGVILLINKQNNPFKSRKILFSFPTLSKAIFGFKSNATLFS